MRGVRRKELIQSRRSIQSGFISMFPQLHRRLLTLTIESKMWPAAVASLAPFEE
jgi:hypothetical protein